MSEYEMITCPTHGVEIPQVSQGFAKEHGLQYGCQSCRDDLANRPDPATMTREDRAAELRPVLGPCYAGFDAVWARVDVLVGRPTYTHELATPEYLEHEIMTGSVPMRQRGS